MAKLYSANATGQTVVDVDQPLEAVASALEATGLSSRENDTFGAAVSVGQPDQDLFDGAVRLSAGAPQIENMDISVALSRPRIGRGRGLTRVTITTTVGSTEQVRFAQTSGSRYTAQQLSVAVARQISARLAPPAVAGPGD